MSGYEIRDTNIRSIVIFGAGLLVVVAVVLIAVARLFDILAARKEPGPAPAPLALTREIPPEPRLQVAGQVDLEAFLERERRTLGSYGWVNQQEGIVRIPVDRAIELLAERKLPARSDMAAPRIE